MIDIEVIQARTQGAVAIALSLPHGARVADALHLAARDPRLEHLDFRCIPVGIHGEVVARDRLLSDGDRIEIYRPLAEDPKIARRKRARGASSRIPADR